MRINFNYKTIITCALVALLSQSATWAQDATEATKSAATANSGEWIYYGIATSIFFILFLMTIVIFKMKAINKAETGEPVSFGKWWSVVNSKIFTKAVPVEKEEDILLDHDYDGIKELDNSLPPWWKYGFYLTIILAVIYLLRFHVFKTGPTPEEEYRTEMSMAAAQLEEYRKQSNDNVDEKTVTMADAAGIAEGKKIFGQSCFPCHGANGEGGVGPNLTDDYWLHGGRINDVFKTIKFGVPDKGMQAWEKTFSPSQIKNLASFIKSIKGTKPANAKAPQGDLFTETASVDKTGAASDSTKTK
ncbi:c-type cytochrome [Chitinophagaceae bacterium LB-8]|uniref:C-type cytochrome n=1 Tax=Paraflavisolibacter caeni TaxID=2982496 RepID=A0A9X2XZR8_9BACT|nr:cbb3-type cytochrome c oxidase N-terminal domain-containing protein [Paraflavisolibacter caeni]MCU7551935.1 c-type cytochrome [Paraflavisolibacter caeni]